MVGGLPIVPSTSVPVGTAVLGDWTMLELVIREDAQFDADRSGDLFKTNQVQYRMEGRYGNAVLRPSAFVKLDLTA